MASESSEDLKVKMVSQERDEDKEKNDGLGISLERVLKTGPRKKLLVIHLNGLLARSFFAYEDCKIGTVRPPDGIIGKYNKKLVFKRPFCYEFLKFCFERFEVGIWSSAKEVYDGGAIHILFGDLRHKLLFTWNQSQCTYTSLKTVENDDKPVFLKELKKLWDKEDSSLPWEKGLYSSSNTLLIDDSPYRAFLNPPNTVIFPQTYMVDQKDDDFLGPKGEMRVYLEGLAAADDVPSYVKEHPFGREAITADHPDWAHYSKILDCFPDRCP